MNIQKQTTTTKLAKAVSFVLGFASIFGACSTNVAGTDEQENSIAEDSQPSIGNSSANIESSSSIASSSSIESSSSIQITTQGNPVHTESSSSSESGEPENPEVDVPIVEKNDLDNLLEAASKNLTLGNAVDCICGTFLTAETELGKLEYNTENHYQDISCDENNGSMEYYQVTKEFYEIIKVFYSVNPDEQEFFKDNCSNELGTYKVSDNRATCTLAMTQDYKDPNWINMKDLVISHCME